MQKRECAARSIIHGVTRRYIYRFEFFLIAINYPIIQRNINLRLIEEKRFVAILILTIAP